MCSIYDYYPFGMLVPNRNYSSPEYRYGFQGQEKDDEIKGEGNSINYKYRMHDPRVGRFFATDPMTAEYPWYSPYSFSGNRVINRIELEGREDAKFTTTLYDPNLHNLTSEEVVAYQQGQTYGLLTGGYILLEIFVTKGKATEYLAKQYAYSTGINIAVEYLFSDEKIDPLKIGADTFMEFDIADAGIDQLTDVALKKYKIGLIKEVFKISAATFFDANLEDGLSMKSFNKDSDKILSDITVNVFAEIVDKKINLKSNDIPILKLNKKTVEKVTTNLKSFALTIYGQNHSENTKSKSTKPKTMEDIRKSLFKETTIKKDVIPIIKKNKVQIIKNREKRETP